MRTRILIPGVLLVFPLTGCGSSAPPEAPPSPPGPVQGRTPAAPGANGEAGNTHGGVGQASSTLDAWSRALTRWVQGDATPAPVVTATAAPVYIDIAALARRHPAWQLADSIEAGRAPLPAERLPLARLPQVRIPAQPGGHSVRDLAIAGAPPPRGAQIETAERIPALHDRAERRQNRSLDAFLGRAAEEQRQEREAKADSLLAALAENIDAARRPDLPDIIPAFPADPIQLEMTNLRLQLLESTRLPAAERERAEARLTALEAKWREALRLQEEQRVAELERLRVETPRRLRAEGEARIARIMQSDATRDAELRNTIQQTQKERIASDFRSTDRRFGILLPGVISPSGSGQASAARAASGSANSGVPGGRSASWTGVPYNLNETFERGVASTAGGSAGAGSQAAALRQRALSEARRWAGIVARRRNWKLQPAGSAGSTDRTAEALRLLNWR